MVFVEQHKRSSSLVYASLKRFPVQIGEALGVLQMIEKAQNLSARENVYRRELIEEHKRPLNAEKVTFPSKT